MSGETSIRRRKKRRPPVIVKRMLRCDYCGRHMDWLAGLYCRLQRGRITYPRAREGRREETPMEKLCLPCLKRAARYRRDRV
jgi:hypothetical protein